ncbi:Dihydrolipoyllysine-residue acetyltransferase component of pyruvate dehydrogenase complex, partial [Fragariocoptes setiger]
MLRFFVRHLITGRPMFKATRIPLPALSPTMESGTIVSWEKKEGDKLNDGDLLAEIETDKATMGFETPEEGYLAKIVIPAGTKNVPLGKLLCIIVDDENEISQYKDFVDDGQTADASSSAPPAPSPPAASIPAPPLPPQPVPAQRPQTAPPTPFQPSTPQPTAGQQSIMPGGRVFATPLARKLARDSGITLSGSGSGPQGRIVAADLKSQPQSVGTGDFQSSSSSFNDLSLSNMRQIIARRLTESKQTIPHYYLTVDLEVDELLKLRTSVNKMLEPENIKVSINDFIVKASALACRQVPEVNSSWHETFIRQYNSVDVNVAVSTDAGLITPIVFNAENKGVKQISMETKSLAERARAGKLQPHEFHGGTFTISNLGMFNISHFSAVINPPQAAILAVGSVRKTFIPHNGDDSQLKTANMLQVTLSCDHRVVDGAVGAVWLRWFRQYIEKPFTMIL